MDEREREEILQSAKERLDEAVEHLQYQVDLCGRMEERTGMKIPTLTSCVSSEGCSVIVSGSAHQSRECWERLFRERPEFRALVRDVLDRMYLIKDR